MRLFPVFLLTLTFFVSSSIVDAQTPDWVKEYRRTVSRMRHKDCQPSLKVLQESLGGNCEAFAKLGASIALKNGLPCQMLFVQRDDEKHLLTLVREKDGRLWCVSFEEIYRVESEDDAIEWTGSPNGWSLEYRSRSGLGVCWNLDPSQWILKWRAVPTKEDLLEDIVVRADTGEVFRSR